MNEEDVLGKGYDAHLMRRLLEYLRPYKWQVAIGIMLSLLMSGMEAVRPYFTKLAVDTDIAQGDKDGLLVTILMFLGIMIMRGILQYINAYLTQWVGQHAIFDLRMQIFRHLQYRSLRFFDRNPLGRLITRVTNDVEVLNDMFSSGIVMVFTDIFTIAGILTFMFLMNVELALVSLSVLPFLFWGTFLFRKKAREAYREVRVQLARINTFMQEHITGILVDQIFHRHKRSYREFSDINAAHTAANVKSIFYYSVFYPAVDFIGAVSIGLIIWYAGAHALEGAVTIGTVMAFVQFNEMFWRPIRDLSEKYNILQTAMASSERIFELLDDTTSIQDAPEPIPLEKAKGKVEFRNVWFAYDHDTRSKNHKDPTYVLKDISFSVDPGETVALVGHTGAGKTSIINLISRFYDVQRGNILVDDYNIKDIRLRDLRRSIAVVLQDVFLFSGTVRHNIDLGDEHISFERVQAAARVVGAHRFIDRLEGTYAADVKERGATLSVGEKQLLSFARALAFNPRILILDEATSSVDTETEHLIQTAIQKLLRNRTSIVIAHRLSTIQKADKILVLHKGVIRESGTHNELLLRDGIYKRLYELQYKQQERPAA